MEFVIILVCVLCVYVVCMNWEIQIAYLCVFVFFGQLKEKETQWSAYIQLTYNSIELNSTSFSATLLLMVSFLCISVRKIMYFFYNFRQFHPTLSNGTVLLLLPWLCVECVCYFIFPYIHTTTMITHKKCWLSENNIYKKKQQQQQHQQKQKSKNKIKSIAEICECVWVYCEPVEREWTFFVTSSSSSKTLHLAFSFLFCFLYQTSKRANHTKQQQQQQIL